MPKTADQLTLLDQVAMWRVRMAEKGRARWGDGVIGDEKRLSSHEISKKWTAYYQAQDAVTKSFMRLSPRAKVTQLQAWTKAVEQLNSRDLKARSTAVKYVQLHCAVELLHHNTARPQTSTPRELDAAALLAETVLIRLPKLRSGIDPLIQQKLSSILALQEATPERTILRSLLDATARDTIEFTPQDRTIGEAYFAKNVREKGNAFEALRVGAATPGEVTKTLLQSLAASPFQTATYQSGLPADEILPQVAAGIDKLLREPRSPRGWKELLVKAQVAIAAVSGDPRAQTSALDAMSSNENLYWAGMHQLGASSAGAIDRPYSENEVSKNVEAAGADALIAKVALAPIAWRDTSVPTLKLQSLDGP